MCLFPEHVISKLRKLDETFSTTSDTTPSNTLYIKILEWCTESNIDNMLLIEMLKLTASTGNQHALLAFCFQRLQTISQANKNLMLSHLEKAAGLGSAFAQNQLGQCYMELENFTTGYQWIQKSANSGNWEGMMNLAECHLFGRGCKQNPYSGFYWCQRAAWMGCSNAIRMLGRLYLEGCGVEKDVHRALKLLGPASLDHIIT